MVLSKAPNHRGTTVVEFALVLPLFLMLIFAIVDFGWYFFVQHTLQFATREGTRLALTGRKLTGDPDRISSIIREINDNAKLAINPDKLQIYIFPVKPDYSDPGGWKTDPANAGDPGAFMRVRTTYTYESLTPIIGPLLAGKTIQAETLYKNELFDTGS
jgi:hypothetical protein